LKEQRSRPGGNSPRTASLRCAFALLRRSPTIFMKKSRPKRLTSRAALRVFRSVGEEKVYLWHKHIIMFGCVRPGNRRTHSSGMHGNHRGGNVMYRNSAAVSRKNVRCMHVINAPT